MPRTLPQQLDPLGVCNDYRSQWTSPTVSQHSTHAPSQQLDEPLVAKAAGMDCKKRNSSSALDSELDLKHTASAISGVYKTESSLFSAGSSSTPLLSRKRQRVSFCTISAPFPNLNSNHIAPDHTMKHSVSCTSLPTFSSSTSETIFKSVSTGELDLSVSPATFVKTILLQSKCLAGSICGEDLVSIASQRVGSDSYFLTLTEEQQQGYDTNKVKAVQTNDVAALRLLFKSGETMQTSNRFGESLLHTACRRGFTDIVNFFVNEARVCPRVRDDMGRTPMHDACWSSAAPDHVVMKLLIMTAPELLLSKDKRGHSPFDYARREHWPNWVAFLNENRQMILDSLVSSCIDGSDLAHANREDRFRYGEDIGTTQ